MELSYPGGCELGLRPIDLHLGALRQLGAEIREEGAASCAGGERRCGGRSCASPCPAWGPQRTSCWPPVAVLAGPLWWGAAQEPEIVDLQEFLRAMGAQVGGAGTPVISIEGGLPLHPAEHTVIGDRIAAATYLCAVGAAGGEIVTTGVDPTT